ncbi:MAG: transposase [Gemmataceae bacterium]
MSDTPDELAAVPEAPAEPATADGFRDVITLDEGKVRGHLDRVVRDTVEQTLNALLDAEADALCGVRRYQRSADRVDTRAGSYDRTLHTTAGEMTLKVSRIRPASP